MTGLVMLGCCSRLFRAAFLRLKRKKSAAAAPSPKIPMVTPSPIPTLAPVESPDAGLAADDDRAGAVAGAD